MEQWNGTMETNLSVAEHGNHYNVVGVVVVVVVVVVIVI